MTVSAQKLCYFVREVVLTTVDSQIIANDPTQLDKRLYETTTIRKAVQKHQNQHYKAQEQLLHPAVVTHRTLI